MPDGCLGSTRLHRASFSSCVIHAPRFAHLEGGGAPGKGPNLGQATSLPRERVKEFQHEAQRYMVAGQQPPMPHGQARCPVCNILTVLKHPRHGPRWCCPCEKGSWCNLKCFAHATRLAGQAQDPCLY